MRLAIIINKQMYQMKHWRTLLELGTRNLIKEKQQEILLG